jgi:hypothetical protein
MPPLRRPDVVPRREASRCLLAVRRRLERVRRGDRLTVTSRWVTQRDGEAFLPPPGPHQRLLPEPTAGRFRVGHASNRMAICGLCRHIADCWSRSLIQRSPSSEATSDLSCPQESNNADRWFESNRGSIVKARACTGPGFHRCRAVVSGRTRRHRARAVAQCPGRRRHRPTRSGRRPRSAGTTPRAADRAPR